MPRRVCRHLRRVRSPGLTADRKNLGPQLWIPLRLFDVVVYGKMTTTRMENLMAQYAILIYTKNAADTDDLTTQERDAHGRHAEDVVAAGAMVAAFALQPAETTATSIRGDVVTDGPFLDAKEVIAGFYVIEAPDLDAALEIARRNPITEQGGGVEVRPVDGGLVVDRSTQG